MPRTKTTTSKWTREAPIAKQKERYEHERELAAAVKYVRTMLVRSVQVAARL